MAIQKAYGVAVAASKIIKDITLGAAAQTIGDASLANLIEFDFELLVPAAATLTNVSSYINGDTVNTNYRRLNMQASDTIVAAGESDNATLARIDVQSSGIIIGSARVVNGRINLIAKHTSHATATTDIINLQSVLYEVAITDVTEISFDTDSGVNLFPSGTRLILLKPYI